MKIHKKQYEDPFLPNRQIVDKSSSMLGTSAQLADRFEPLMRRADRELFGLVLNFVWLELHFVYNGRRRRARSGNCVVDDRAFSEFMRTTVGTGHKTLTSNLTFTIITSYLKDFFPDFLDHDPLEEPDYFAFPYKNVSLEHMAFVYKMYDRMEMLEHAEENAVCFLDFSNWAVNQAFCYNDDVGETIYTLTKAGYHWAHINNVNIGKQWHKDNLNFDI